ncbi:MAG: AraC family transcriptional regulator [Ketobacteraceae bacterium]|nr:AraC family transcriptional regulator [Ketobacteraceae bacterium]
MMSSSTYKAIAFFVFTCISLSGFAQPDITREAKEPSLNTDKRQQASMAVQALSSDIQALKSSIIALNKDIRTLEEDMLFPANTQMTVFVSLDVGTFFTLETAKLKLDGKLVTTHIYSGHEVEAMANSGIHRLYVGNISNGDHEVTAFFTGKGPHGRPFKRGTSLKVSKTSGSKYVELHIGDSSSKEQPEFTVKQW